MLYPRNIKSRILEAAGDTPAILINGARQVGKSTLFKLLFEPEKPPKQITFDSYSALAAAKDSPQSYVDALPERVLLDEIQRVPELLVAIKASIDANRKPGRFFLTGSTNLLMLPQLSESLAGRMEIKNLWPLSEGEIRGFKETFVDDLFSDKKLPYCEMISESELLHRLVQGGYPEALEREKKNRRHEWFESYVSTILQREVRDIANIEKLSEIPLLLSLIATRSGASLNSSDLTRETNIPNTTLKRYLSILEAVFLTVTVRPWYSNKGKRLAKHPKLFIGDTGLLSYLLEVDEENLAKDRKLFGNILENFVLLELCKQLTWSEARAKLFHLRSLDNSLEVDFVLEKPNGTICGIEVKSSSSVGPSEFKGLRELRTTAGKKFHRGIVLYTGKDTVHFDKNLIALPISALWNFSSDERGYSCYGFRLGTTENDFLEQLHVRRLPEPSKEKSNFPKFLKYYNIGNVPLVDDEVKWEPTFRFADIDGIYKLYKIEGFVNAPIKLIEEKLTEHYGNPLKSGEGRKWSWGGTKITVIPSKQSEQLIYMTHDELSNRAAELMAP